MAMSAPMARREPSFSDAMPREMNSYSSSNDQLGTERPMAMSAPMARREPSFSDAMPREMNSYSSSNDQLGSERPMAAMSAYRTNDAPSFFGRPRAENPPNKPKRATTKKAPLFGKAKPTSSPFGKATSSNAVTSQIIPTMKTLHQEILGRLNKIESMIAQSGVATTSESLQEGQSQFYSNGGQDGGRRRAPPQRGVQAMRATLARRGTKRQRGRRGTKRRGRA